MKPITPEELNELAKRAEGIARGLECDARFVDAADMRRIAEILPQFARLMEVAEGLDGALRHMQFCQDCGESSWEDCEGGREAIAALAAYEAWKKPEEK